VFGRLALSGVVFKTGGWLLNVDVTPEAGKLPQDGGVGSVVCTPDTCMEELISRTSDGPAPVDLFLSCLWTTRALFAAATRRRIIWSSESESSENESSSCNRIICYWSLNESIPNVLRKQIWIDINKKTDP